MVAVIVGSTGLVGNLLLEKLLEDSYYTQIISVSRKPVSISTNKLKQVLISELSQLESVRDQLKGDHYFCCLGTTIKTAGSKESFKKVDYDGVWSFAKVAEFYQAQSFSMITAMGANSRSIIFYNQIKGDIEEAVSKLKLKKLIILRPGLLIGKRKEERFGEHLAISSYRLLEKFLSKNLRKKIATNIESLARKMIEESKSENIGIKIITSDNF